MQILDIKIGRMLMTYFDIDADGYRTASDSWSIRYDN